MELSLNTRVILESPYGSLRDEAGAIIRNGQRGYVRGTPVDGRIRIAFPGVPVSGTPQRATLVLTLEEWWVRPATPPEIDNWDSPTF